MSVFRLGQEKQPSICILLASFDWGLASARRVFRSSTDTSEVMSFDCPGSQCVEKPKVLPFDSTWKPVWCSLRFYLLILPGKQCGAT